MRSCARRAVASRSGSGCRRRRPRWRRWRASWWGRKRECRIVDASAPKPLDVKVHVPVESMTDLHGVVHGDSDQPLHGSIWPAIYPELLRLIRAHNSTIVFVNNRRSAERLALRLNELAAAEEGTGEEDGRRRMRRLPERRGAGAGAARDRPRSPRLTRAGGAAGGGGAAEGGRDPLHRGDLQPRAGDRHGRRRPRAAGRVAEVGGGWPAADRARWARRRRGLAGADLPQVPRRPAGVRGAGEADARRGDRADGGAAQPAGRAGAADRRDGGLRGGAGGG